MGISVSMKEKPQVTVLMSVYNGEKYLREAIDSILGQTFKDFEYLIIDDGSTDSSSDIIRSYTDSRIRLIQNEKNIGLTRSLNKGLKLAKGEYIARMDADDISMPERLEKQVRFLDEHKNVALISSSVIFIDSCGKEVRRWDLATDSDEIKSIFLRDQNQILHPFSMYKKRCVEKVGMYREEFEVAQDVDLWMRMIERYDIANVQEALGVYRIGRNSVTTGKWKLQRSKHHLGYIYAIQRKTFGRDCLGYEPAGASFQALRDELARGFFARRRILSKNYLICAQKYAYNHGKRELKSEIIYYLKSIANNPLNIEAWCGLCNIQMFLRGVDKIRKRLRNYSVNFLRR
jgi:glycosyltransferase involved in cell wall biosynthesis